MRSSSWGKRASLAGELHSQEENVTEADMVRHVLSKLKTPITIGSPTVANEVMRRAGFDVAVTPRPATCISACKSSVTGAAWSLQSHSLVSSVVRHVKGSESHLSQRINCDVSNAGTDDRSLRGRLADRQCGHQGSETVVVVRVTPHQGDSERLSQGKGSYEAAYCCEYSTRHETQKRMDKTP